MPAQQGPQRAPEQAITPHRPIVVGDIIEDAAILTARDLGDRLPAPERWRRAIRGPYWRWLSVRSRGPSPRSYSSAIARRVSNLGRPLFPALALLLGRRVGDRSWPCATPWWPSFTGRSQTQRRTQSQRGVGFGHAALDQARPQGELALQTAAYDDDRTVKDFLRHQGAGRPARASTATAGVG